MEELHKIRPAEYHSSSRSFNIYSGAVKGSQNGWITNNLEWTYRLLKQPTRIRRQRVLLTFIWSLTRTEF